MYAVGISLNSSVTYVPLAEQWNGQEWAIVPTPIPADATTATELSAIACSSQNHGMAVGYYWNGSACLGLAEHWNGTIWAIQPARTQPAP